jgi:hypothetical protein
MLNKITNLKFIDIRIIFILIILILLFLSMPNTFFPSKKVFLINENSYHTIGQIITENGNKIIFSKKNEAGFLLYGPYTQLTIGRYEALYLLSVYGDSDKTGAILDIDAFKDGISKQVNLKEVITNNDWKEYKLEFIVTEKEALNHLYQFRVQTTGLSEVKVKSITLIKK